MECQAASEHIPSHRVCCVSQGPVGCIMWVCGSDFADRNEQKHCAGFVRRLRVGLCPGARPVTVLAHGTLSRVCTLRFCGGP